MTMKPVATLALFAALLAGCAGSPAPPPPPLLDLGAMIDRGPAPIAASPADTSVWQLVHPLRVPATAERELVLVADGQGQLRPWQHRRWSEPPRDSLQRLLLADLARLRGAQRVWGGSLPTGVRADRELRVEVLAWDAVEPEGEVRLTARWSLTSPVGGVPPQVQQRSFSSAWRPNSADELLRAHRDVLAQLAQAIASSG